MSRTALVLGAGGFLGSHLCRRLVREGWDVTGVVRDPAAAHVDARLGEDVEQLRIVAGDAADPALLEALAPQADAVFPFAGPSGAAGSLDRPQADLAGNAATQLALLEVLRRHESPARVVFPGSRLQYGRTRRVPVAEDHPLEPRSPYGVSKLAAEHYHRLYHDLHGVATCSLRISNPYGPGQDRPDRAFGVVGTFISMAARGETIPLFGGGAQLRDYVYVDDLIDLMVLAATHPAAVGRAFNAGGPRGVMLREMAETVVATVGSGAVRDTPWDPSAAAVETGDYVSDCSLVGDVLGWTPQRDLDEGLALTWSALEPVLGLRR